MDLVVETDLGRDADDFFALCYLIRTGVKIKALTLTPGDPDQVAVARFLLKQCLIDAPIGVPGDRGKKSVTPFHHEVMAEYGAKPDYEPNGVGFQIIEQACVAAGKPLDLFVIGPCTNAGNVMRRQKARGESNFFNSITMQGGFCSYDIHRPKDALDKFNGMITCPTFNLNGDVVYGKELIDYQCPKRFVGKNVCHAVVFNKDRHEQFRRTGYDGDESVHQATNLFDLGAYTYFKKHPEKKFHDPTAAVCMLHPEVATYVKGITYREKGGWGTKLDENGYDIAVELNHDALWEYLSKGV